MRGNTNSTFILSRDRLAIALVYLHEAEGVLDLGRHLTVLRSLRRVAHEVHVPSVELVHVRETALGEGPQKVDSL